MRFLSPFEQRRGVQASLSPALKAHLREGSWAKQLTQYYSTVLYSTVQTEAETSWRPPCDAVTPRGPRSGRACAAFGAWPYKHKKVKFSQREKNVKK